MINLVWLLIVAVILCILSYFSFRRIMSPSFISSLVFSACILLAIIGNLMFWHETITYKAPVVISTSLLSIFLGELFVEFLVRKKTTVGKTVPGASLDPEKPIITTKYQAILNIIIFLLGILIVFLIFKEEYALARKVGWNPSSANSSFFAHVRGAFLNGERLPTYVSILDYIVQGFGLVSILLMTRQFFGGKKFFSILHLINIIPLGISQILSTSRNGFILDVIILVFGIYLYGYVRYKKISISKLIVFSLAITFVFVLLFLFLGSLTLKVGGWTNTINVICSYAGSPIVAFDKAISSGDIFKNDYFGSNSFYGLYSLLQRIIPSIESPSQFNGFVRFADGTATNIYTAFSAFYFDFGIFGCIFISFLVGCFFSFVYTLVYRKKNNIIIDFYSSFISYYIVYLSLAPSITTSLFGITRVFQLLMSLAFLLIYFGLPKIFKFFKRKKVAGDLAFALLTQTVSFALSVVMSLLVPKVLGINDYSYWQLFIFYSTYVGFFHFGYCDGIYIEHGGKDADELNKKSLSSQCVVFSISQIVIAVGIGTVLCFLEQSDYNRIIVIILTAVYLVFSNIGLFFGYLLQAIKKVKIYSLSLLIEKGCFLVAVIILLTIKVTDFWVYIVIYVACRLLFFMVLFIASRKIVFSKPEIKRETFSEIFSYIKVGINIMLAGIAGLLIMGVSRFLIDKVWGINEFGKFSFSISIGSFALTFLSQVSLVFFPTLRTFDKNRQKSIYISMKKTASLLLTLVYFMYFVLKVLVRGWLPNYADSIVYLGLILPICVYDGKMQMIFTTYFKVLKEQKKLLIINTISLATTLAVSLLFAYVFNNSIGVVVGSIIGIMVRSTLSEIYLGRYFNYLGLKQMIPDLVIALLFSISTMLFNDFVSFAIAFVGYAFVVAINKKYISSLLSKAKTALGE